MKTLAEYAVKAFNTGSDKFGESVTGTRELYYDTFQPTPYWTMTVLLVQKDGHPCTSGIGFYRKGDTLNVCSGHMLPWTIDITPEIELELNTAVRNK
jgi:hypothetical protein